MEYLNFDLRVRRGDAGGYRLLAESEGHGEVAAEVLLDPADAALQDQLRRLAARETDPRALEALGAALFDVLLAGPVATLFERSYGAAAADPEVGLRLRLRIDPPEVAALPWELLYSRADGEFVATRVESPLVRYVEIARVRRELATRFPLRVLVAIPAGTDELPPVSADEEKTIIDQALAGLRDAEVTYLHELHADRRVTWTRIQECLAEGEYHCFHFVGHGGFHAERGHLALDGEDGGVEYVPDERFARLFTNHQAMKLVVLNACESATLSTSRPLEGCAANLVKAGVPAVVAMQYGVRDRAAVDFARSFYHSLFRSAERGRVDVAISQGRHVLAAKHAGQRELATPVLFMHTASGVLFVPERGRWRDLPLSTRARHTLKAAGEETGSESELARFRRRIRIGKGVVRAGFGVALLAFAGLWIGALDLLKLETGAEFATMAVGDSIAAAAISDELRVVTIEVRGLSVAETRERIAAAVGDLAAAGAAVIALDATFAVAADGGFAEEPESGRALVEAIRAVRPATAVVVAARTLVGGRLAVPEPLREAAAGVGHICSETKLGLSRSLPLIVAARGGGHLPSFALTAYAAYRGGAIAAAPDGGALVVVAPEEPAVHFAASDIEVPRAATGECGAIGPGDEVAHRFLRLSPLEALRGRAVQAAEIGAAGESFRGKLVVVGLLGVGGLVDDLYGDREDVFWQADAIDNLLRDEELRPLPDLTQLPLLLLFAGCGAALRLRFLRRRGLGRAVASAVAVAFLALVGYIYGKFDILINPAYHVAAFGFAWWLAGSTAERWLR